jgi:hypothetical protein
MIDLELVLVTVAAVVVVLAICAQDAIARLVETSLAVHLYFNLTRC